MFKKEKKHINDYKLRYQELDIARRYHEGYSKKLGLKNYRMKIIAEREKKILRSLISNRCGGIHTILDFPCGSGKLSAIFKQTAFSICAADISEAMLSMAKETYPAIANFQGLIRADITKIPFKSESFDCIICLRLMHRLPPEVRQEILHELVRVTKQYVIVSYGIAQVADKVRRFLMKRNPKSAYWMATERDLENEVARAGLRVLNVHSVIPYFYYERIFLLEKKV